MITVIGWDGTPLPPYAQERLDAATLVAGGARHLDAVRLPRDAHKVVMGPVSEALDAIEAHDGPVAVVASGDPGFFGIVRSLRERDLEPEVLPSVSSVAHAFGRAGLPWDDALVVSAHGRGLRRAANACRAYPKVAVLTGPDVGPYELAQALDGVDRTYVICEDLGGAQERISWRTRVEWADWGDPNVVLVLDQARIGGDRGWVAGARPGPDGWALPEDAFEHRDSMITKSEVRALVLARLGPRVGDLVWDVGAASGSVGIECARLGAAVIAIERDGDACAGIALNAVVHGVDVQVVHDAAPAALTALPDPDAIFVGGGGLDVIRACAGRGARAIVATLASVERVGPAMQALDGYRADGVQLQASRLAALPGSVHRLAAVNPVFVVWGTR